MIVALLQHITGGYAATTFGAHSNLAQPDFRYLPTVRITSNETHDCERKERMCIDRYFYEKSCDVEEVHSP